MPPVAMIASLMILLASSISIASPPPPALPDPLGNAPGKTCQPIRDTYHSFSLQIENDNFMTTDRDYSSGVRANLHSNRVPFLSREQSDGVSTWVKSLPFIGEEDSNTAFDIGFGHQIYTPANKSATDVVENERPYAGLAYLMLGIMQYDRSRLSTWEIMMGLVGPGTLAEEIQGAVHDWKGRNRAKGWHNQLQNEAIFNLFHDRRWKFNAGGNHGWGIDVIPQVNLALGTAFISASLHAEVRSGWNLPDDFGDDYIRPATRSSSPGCRNKTEAPFSWDNVGLYAFASGGWTGVHRDVLLDGNLFSESHSVEKEPLVHEFAYGIALVVNRIKVTGSVVTIAPRYTTQTTDQQYGSVSVSFSW